MSAPILNSNANSALISTLSNSTALVNPYLYNLEKLLPFGANYWTTIDPVQGSGADTGFAHNSVIDFDLPKWGFLRTCILEFGVITNNTNETSVSSPSGVLSLIDSVEILSASRRIQYLSWADILALYSDMPPKYRECVRQHLTQGTNVKDINSAKNNARQAHKYGIALPFSLFGSHKLNPNLLFQEPLRIRIHLSNGVMGYAAGVVNAGKTAIENAVKNTAKMYKPQLQCEFFNPPKEMDEEVLDKNYGDGELTLLTYDFHDENEVKTTEIYANNDSQTITMDVKDVGVISDMYVMCHIDPNDVIDGTETQPAKDVNGVLVDTPATLLAISKLQRTPDAIGNFVKGGIKVDNITVLANGQELFNMDGELLECWSRKTDAKDGYAYGDNASNPNMIGEYVYKIPFGLSDDKRIMGGGMSLRELHNVQVKITIPSTQFTGHTYIDGTRGTPLAVQSNISNAVAFTAGAAGTLVKTPRFKISCRVMLKKYQVLTIESANGRVNTSVAN